MNEQSTWAFKVNAKEYLGTLQNEYKDESYCTDRVLGTYYIAGFLTFLGIEHNLLNEVEN
jgi:hypothetical protein